MCGTRALLAALEVMVEAGHLTTLSLWKKEKASKVNCWPSF